MSETKNNTQGQKPKTSKTTIASLIFGVLGVSIVGVTSILFPWELDKVILYMLCTYLVALISLVLGIAGLIRIKRSNSNGRVLAVLGIIVASVSATSMLIVWLRCCQEADKRSQCAANFARHIYIGLHCYSNDHFGKYPSPDKWCDSLEKTDYILRERLICPGDKQGPCSYAMNPNTEPNSPNYFVLLFETKGGWNQFGGPEILTTDNHKGKGCNVLFNDGRIKFVKTEQLSELKWDIEENQENSSGNFRRPGNEEELKYWLKNMVWYHRFTNEEINAATGLSENKIIAALKKFNIRPGNRPKRAKDAPLLVLPYPGGRHPRIGFLDGAIDPQRETKFSVFTPWDINSYVVVDVPEAIWSNLGLTYLAHTHIDTIWTKQGIDLPKLEWKLKPDGTLDIERKLPNGIAFGMQVKPTTKAVRMELWLKNGTDQKLSDLRVQNCVMTKMAVGFEQQTNDNKVLTNPYVACRSSDGKQWIITAWENCNNPWANDKCPCFHSDPKFPDLEPDQTYKLKGWLSFYEGTDIEAEFKRIEATGWLEK